MLIQPTFIASRYRVPVVCCDCGTEAPPCNLYSLRVGQGWEGFALGIRVKQTDGSHRTEHIGTCRNCVAIQEGK